MNVRWFFSSPALQGWVFKRKRFLARFSGLVPVGAQPHNPWLKPKQGRPLKRPLESVFGPLPPASRPGLDKSRFIGEHS